MQALKRLAPRVPAPLVAVVLGIGAVYGLGLDRQGVAVVGPVPAGFPTPRLPMIQTSEIGPLVFGACGMAVARAKGLFLAMLERTGVAGRIGAEHFFPTVHAGVEAFLEAQSNLRACRSS